AGNAAGLRREDLVPGRRIDAGQRDIGAEPIDQQRAEREPDPLLEFLGLGERREIEVGGKLFCCRDHGPEAPVPPPKTPTARSGRPPLELYTHQPPCSPPSPFA